MSMRFNKFEGTWEFGPVSICEAQGYAISIGVVDKSKPGLNSLNQGLDKFEKKVARIVHASGMPQMRDALKGVREETANVADGFSGFSRHYSRGWPAARLLLA